MRGRTLRLGLAVLEAALAAALAVTLVGCSSRQPDDRFGGRGGDTDEPIKIGAVVSLTGTYAGLGDPEKNAHRDGGQAHQRCRRHQRSPDRSHHRR